MSVQVGAYDVLSVPAGAWRSLECVGAEPVQVVVLTEGDGRVLLEWSPDIVATAAEQGVALDANGYVAPAELVRR